MLFKDTVAVGDEDGLKDYLGGIQKTMTWKTWKPFVQGAEQTYIIPAIGRELYAVLTGPSLNDYQADLKHMLKMALAWYAYLDALPSLITATGDGGITTVTPLNAQAMTKWMYVDSKKSHLEKAERYLEAALSWLEHNAAHFPEWMESDAYTIQKAQFIASATDATRYFPALQNSRRLYLSIRSYFNGAEEDFIRPVLGDALYLALKAKLAAGGLDLFIWEDEVLKLARKALVQYGFSQAVPYLNLNTDFRLVSETDGILNEDVPGNARLNIIRQDALDKALQKAAELKNYLNKTASSTVLPEYFSSDLYVAPAGSYQRRPTNDPSNPYFVL